MDRLNETKTKKANQIDEEKAKQLIEKMASAYHQQIKMLAPFINDLSKYVPGRRKRSLHIGLFGYARNADGVQLPRAIKFCAALYSYGLPPEILGLHALSEKELDSLVDMYPSFETDLQDALQFYNSENMSVFPESIQRQVEPLIKRFNPEINQKHTKITSIIVKDIKQKNTVSLREDIDRADGLRCFLG